MAALKTSKIVTFLIAILFVLNFQSLHSTELIDAVLKGNYNQVESLLKSGVDIINEQDEDGFTAIMRAVQMSNLCPEGLGLKIIKLLLLYNPDLTIENIRGDTALVLAHNKIEATSGKAKEMVLEIVDLLSSKMPTMSFERTIIMKSCYLSFEQNDWNGAIVEYLWNHLDEKIISIVAPQLLKKLFKKFQIFVKIVQMAK